MKLESWIAWKFIFNKKSLWNESLPLALFGLLLGVSSLFVSMAVMSGFEYTLEKSMTDVTGHVTLIKKRRDNEPWIELSKKLKDLEPELKSVLPFTYIEAILARQGQVGGVMIQGVDPVELDQVLHLRSRVITGAVDLSAPAANEKPKAMIGKSLAHTMGLKVGDTFKVIVPLPHDIDPTQFRRKIGEFQVSGIMDFGKHEWNERFIISDIKTTQVLAEVGERYTGLLMRFTDAHIAREASVRLYENLGPDYWIRDWREVNENLFEAVAIERWVIFFVVLIIVLVAAFNVSSALFVNVIRRYPDIAILKTLGVPQKSLLQIFSVQGLFIGVVGLVGGAIGGWILCRLFEFYQSRFQLISGAVYKIDSIQLTLRPQDLIIISVSTLLICFFSSLAPALRGSRIQPTQGLRYE